MIPPTPTSTPQQHHILLVDDDRELCQLLSEYLDGEGFSTHTAYSGQDALDIITPTASFDAVVLDIMMPLMSGLEVLQRVRQHSSVPIIMLTGRGDDVDRIVGLEMGADDYLGKPCNPRELAARLKAVLRRSGAKNPMGDSATPDTIVSTLLHYHMHGIHLDTGQLTVQVNNITLNVTSAEFKVLQLLMAAAGTVLTKESLTEQALQRKLSAHDRSIDVHVSRLRQKIMTAGVDQKVIKSIRGVGYQFLPDDSTNTR